MLSIAKRISGSANTPISIGSRGMPDLRANRSNVKRDSAPIGSWPTRDSSSPTSIISNALINTPSDAAAMMTRLSSMIAANSGGPIISARMAMGPISTRVMRSLDISPKTDANRAISMALRPCRFLVSAGPSNVVATAAPVPGIETRIAGMLPP